MSEGKISLAVVSANGREWNLITDTVVAVNATYTSRGQLLLAIVPKENKNQIVYYVANKDGREGNELYISNNSIWIEPRPVPAPTPQPTPTRKPSP
jgi:hypothetical protein